jgi:hypothetical protein
MRDSPHVRVALRPSRFAGAAILLGAAATTALALSLPLDSWAIAAALIAIGLVAVRGVRQCAGSDVPACIEVGLDRRLALTARDGRVREGSILDDSYVGEQLTTIVWRPDRARWYEPARTIVILKDSLAADDFRRLRVILRYGQPATDGLTSGREAG